MRTRCCCNCRHDIRVWEDGECTNHCEIDGHYIEYAIPIERFDSAPSIDIVRCKECVHWQSEKYWCKMFKIGTPADGYCYMGERKESE